jgi:hypothetical protein
LPPFDVEFYLRYIKIEQCFKTVSIANINKAYDEALKHFGSNDVQLWLDYIKYRHYNNTNDNLSGISEIYWKAVKQINQDLVDDFNQKFNLLKIKLENLGVSNMENNDIE